MKMYFVNKQRYHLRPIHRKLMTKMQTLVFLSKYLHHTSLVYNLLSLLSLLQVHHNVHDKFTNVQYTQSNHWLYSIDWFWVSRYITLNPPQSALQGLEWL